MTIPQPTPEDLAADLEEHYAFLHENIVQVSWAKRPETTADQPKFPHQFQHADAKHTTWASAIRRAAAAEAEARELRAKLSDIYSRTVTM